MHEEGELMDNEFATHGPDYELGARRMQVLLLREALAAYGQHRDYCDGDRCRCGLAEALRIGPDARAVCGLPEPPKIVVVCAWCRDAQEQTASARANGYDVTHGMCPVCTAKWEADHVEQHDPAEAGPGMVYVCRECHWRDRGGALAASHHWATGHAVRGRDWPEAWGNAQFSEARRG